ncbi:MAG: hypothetical protein JRF63_15390 [Deltaproteobacteria bacterium]|nr:hypothetical protein [Deltaproteobacteria bacterium]
MKFTEHKIETPEGHSLVLMVTPDQNVRVDRARLEELRDIGAQGSIDKEIVWEVERHKGEVAALMLRCRDEDGQVSWGFTDDLSDEECQELGYLLVKSQVTTYRSLVENGVQGHFVVELGERETRALNTGKMRRVGELGQILQRLDSDDPRAMVPMFQTWLLQNFMYRLHLTADETLETFLPRSLPILEGGRRLVKRMLDGLPAGEL